MGNNITNYTLPDISDQVRHRQQITNQHADNVSSYPDYDNHGPCPKYEEAPFMEIRFYLIGIAGFSICAIGIIFNIILLKILLQPALRTTYLLYLSALAIIDINIAITYVVVMSIATWYEYFNNYLLYQIWHVCLPYFFTLSRIVTLASAYLIVACTVERYLEVMQLYLHRTLVRITHTKRYVVVASVILASVAFRLVVFWEIDVVQNKICEGTFSYYGLDRTWLVNDFYYSKVYTFYAVHTVQIFFPFATLLLLNVLIVRKWKIVVRRDTIHHQLISIDLSCQFGEGSEDGQTSTINRRKGRRSGNDEIRKRVRCAQSARAMMIAIVSSYLLCNLLNVVLTFLEHLDRELLQKHSDFYSFASDTVTLLTVVNATVRLPIYYGSNLKIRTEIVKLLRECVGAKDTPAPATFNRLSTLEWLQKRAMRHSDSRQSDEPATDEGNGNSVARSQRRLLWNMETAVRNGNGNIMGIEDGEASV